MESVETIIVGGGQAGLATSYFLNQHGHEHVVLEQAAQPASSWRTNRWDSFTLVTPNWTLMLPGAEYDGPDRDGFLPRADIVAYFDRYVAQFQPPMQCNVRVLAVVPEDSRGYRVITPERTFRAENVVIATGHEQHPRIPPFAAALSPEITQLHSSTYRNPESLPDGAVLVVGSAQSGGQIAEELYLRGRQVYLSVGSAGRAPRRYRGKDVFEWLHLSGFLDITPDKLPFPKVRFAPPHVSGGNGGHTLNLHQFARDGVKLLGHLRGASGHTIALAPDLYQTLERVDQFEREIQQRIDGYIAANALDAPAEELPQLRDGYQQPVLEALDLQVQAAGVSTIVWATGYTFDYSFVHAPVFADDGSPIQTRGVTDRAGLYFAGLPWMPSLKTGILVGMAESARHVASTIVGARGRLMSGAPAA